MINLAKSIKKLKIATDNNESLDHTTTNILISTPFTITNISSLNNSIFEWKKKGEKVISMKRVVNIYTFIHVVDILKLYEAVKDHKEQIQSRSNKYNPKKRNTKGWIVLYLADQLEYSGRQTTRYLTAARRLKSLNNRGITYDILVLSKCFLSDFWCTEKAYQVFLEELRDY
jgi:hypothetical protein